MPTYISLINWTEKGAAGFKDTVDRAEAGKALAGTFGGDIFRFHPSADPLPDRDRGGAGPLADAALSEGDHGRDHRARGDADRR